MLYKMSLLLIYFICTFLFQVCKSHWLVVAILVQIQNTSINTKFCWMVANLDCEPLEST